MIKIAIVEDEEECARQTKEYLLRFAEENDYSFSIDEYTDAISFLEGYTSFDLVLMDIRMPHMDGLQAAKKLRQLDDKVPLIFLTNFVKYAIKGYEVNAVDYILKPLSYARLSSLMKKTLRNVIKNDDVIFVRANGVMRKIYTSEILYVQVKGHYLLYYTEKGRIETWGSLKNAESSLPEKYFARCEHAYIVNLKYVESVEKETIRLKNGEELPVSERKRKEFLNKLSEYVKG